MAGYIGSRLSNSVVNLDGVTIGSATKFQPFIGSIAAFAMSSAPSGWLVCNGAEYAIADYGDLYGVISTTWGALTDGAGNSGTTHFVVPDLRGEFLRGFDNGYGSDPDTANRIGGDAVGSSQGHSIVNHIHNVYGGSHTGNADYGFRRLFTGASYPDGSAYGNSTGHKVPLTNYSGFTSNVAEVKRIQAQDVLGNYAQNNGSSTTSENRPRNKNVQYCIKY